MPNAPEHLLNGWPSPTEMAQILPLTKSERAEILEGISTSNSKLIAKYQEIYREFEKELTKLVTNDVIAEVNKGKALKVDIKVEVKKRVEEAIKKIKRPNVANQFEDPESRVETTYKKTKSWW